MDDLTRRGFVLRSGATLGAIGVVGLPWEAAAAPSSLALNPSHQRTYSALVATLAAANRLAADEATVADAAGHFSGWYAGLPRHQRQHVDRVLDAMERATPAGFSAVDGSEQLVTLRAWRHAPVHADGSPWSAEGARRRAFAQHAVSYASPPYGPGDDMKYVPLPL